MHFRNLLAELSTGVDWRSHIGLHVWPQPHPTDPDCSDNTCDDVLSEEFIKYSLSFSVSLCPWRSMHSWIYNRVLRFIFGILHLSVWLGIYVQSCASLVLSNGLCSAISINWACFWLEGVINSQSWGFLANYHVSLKNRWVALQWQSPLWWSMTSSWLRHF